MTEIFEAMYKFLSQLGIPVYPENGVPSDAVFPYLTWSPVQPNWGEASLMPVRIWDRSGTYAGLSSLVDQLSDMIDRSVVMDAGSKGYVYLYRGDPWAQPQPLQDTDVKVMYVNLEIIAFL